MSLSRTITEFDSLPGTALLTIKDISVLSSRSPATLWREVQRKRLSPPVHLSSNAARWRASDVRVYLGGCHER